MYLIDKNNEEIYNELYFRVRILCKYYIYLITVRWRSRVM